MAIGGLGKGKGVANIFATPFVLSRNEGDD